MKLNFEDSAEPESINVSLDEEIEAEQGLLLDGVQQLLSKTEKISDSEGEKKISPELMSEIETEANDVKEGVLSLSERGFITPEFAVILAGLIGSFSILANPELMATLNLEYGTSTKIGIAATVVATVSIISMGLKAIKGEALEFNLEELKRRWGIGDK